jgi:hypothetical protein
LDAGHSFSNLLCHLIAFFSLHILKDNSANSVSLRVFNKLPHGTKALELCRSEQNMESEQMKTQKFTRTKTLAFLMFVSLTMFLTATSASASPLSDYQHGYRVGFQFGEKLGYKTGNEVCLKYGQQGVLNKIPRVKVNVKWTESYTKGIEKGFKAGFIDGYNKARFECLKK